MSRFNLKVLNIFTKKSVSVCVCVCVCVCVYFKAHILKQFCFIIRIIILNFIIQNQLKNWYLFYDFVKFLDISVSGYFSFQ